ncbi:hypothetical protein E2C01_064636 [Portunus trituberculatus]|uniref:Uncharacterized protein n=1 Tax=Portunus trituberculatus TaxID=210409 RepID=A0A5B7HKW7_PORTR|nr:hypothetical protein [Portunus trituberculatus]
MDRSIELSPKICKVDEDELPLCSKLVPIQEWIKRRAQLRYRPGTDVGPSCSSNAPGHGTILALMSGQAAALTSPGTILALMSGQAVALMPPGTNLALMSGQAAALTSPGTILALISGQAAALTSPGIILALILDQVS